MSQSQDINAFALGSYRNNSSQVNNGPNLPDGMTGAYSNQNMPGIKQMQKNHRMTPILESNMSASSPSNRSLIYQNSKAGS